MHLEHELSQRNGIMRSAALQELGHSPHELRRALAARRVVRPQRGWIALPSADPELVFAARHHVVLTCVSQASRLGLWVLDDDRSHVAGAQTARKSTAPNCRIHWRTPLVPRAPGRLTDPIENVLAQVAACQPHDAALAIWDSALNKKLIDIHALESLPLRGAARQLLEHCSPFADSGIETLFRTRLRWLGIPLRTQVWVHGRRVDVLIGDRLVVQIDGKQHAGAQREQDRRHDAALLQRGYYVIRIGYAQIMHDWSSVQEAVLGAVARGLHLSRQPASQT